MKTFILLSVLLFCSITYGLVARKSCWKLNTQIACFRFDEKCKTNDECNANEICCVHECGTQCRNVDLIGKKEEKRELQSAPQPGPKGCPAPVDNAIPCPMSHKACNTDSDCGDQNICCTIACGTACRKNSGP